MLPRSRLNTPVAGLLAALLLAACGSQAVPSTTPSVGAISSSPGGTATPVADAASREAYSAAMCPVFTGILGVDPRLAAMREAGAAGGDMSVHATEIAEVGDELLSLLNDLEAVPAWTSGANLRHHLTTALHGIRARLLHVEGNPGAGTAAGDLAALPFMASEAMDLAMQDAIEGGLTCEDDS